MTEAALDEQRDKQWDNALIEAKFSGVFLLSAAVCRSAELRRNIEALKEKVQEVTAQPPFVDERKTNLIYEV